MPTVKLEMILTMPAKLQREYLSEIQMKQGQEKK